MNTNLQPILLRLSEVAEILGLGRTKVFLMTRSGELPIVRIGKAVRVPREALEAWVKRQAEEQNGERE